VDGSVGSEPPTTLTLACGNDGSALASTAEASTVLREAASEESNTAEDADAPLADADADASNRAVVAAEQKG